MYYAFLCAGLVEMYIQLFVVCSESFKYIRHAQHNAP